MQIILRTSMTKVKKKMTIRTSYQAPTTVILSVRKWFRHNKSGWHCSVTDSWLSCNSILISANSI